MKSIYVVTIRSSRKQQKVNKQSQYLSWKDFPFIWVVVSGQEYSFFRKYYSTAEGKKDKIPIITDAHRVQTKCQG